MRWNYVSTRYHISNNYVQELDQYLNIEGKGEKLFFYQFFSKILRV